MFYSDTPPSTRARRRWRALPALAVGALLWGASASRAQDTTPNAAVDAAPAPQWMQLSPPPERTVNGVRVRLRAICWCRANQLNLPANQWVERPDAIGLAVRYEVRGDTEGKVGALTQARIYGSSGAPNSAQSPQTNIAPQGNGGVLFWSGANPRWQKAALRIEWNGDAANENSQGKFSHPVEFELPVPAQTDVAQNAKGQWTSVHGTQYSMRQVMVATKPFKAANASFEWPAGFYFSIQHEYPPETPGSDATPSIEEDTPEIIAIGADGSETSLQAEFGGSWGISDVFAQTKSGGFDQGVRFNHTKPLPPGTKSVKLRFLARESSDAWRDESALRQFQFSLDLTKVPLPPVAPNWKPFAIARGQRLEVAVDEWKDISALSTLGFMARFSARDLAHPDDAHRLWLLRGSKLSIWNDYGPVSARILDHDDLKATSGFRGVYHFTGLSASWWRPDGTPVTGSQTQRAATFTMPNPADTNGENQLPVANAPLAIEGTWDEWLAAEHDWTWNDLPIPRPGQSLEINREMQGDGARLVLRKIAAFDGTHALPGADAEFFAGVGHPAGVMAVFEVLQTSVPGAVLDLDTAAPKQGAQLAELSDDKGRELRLFSYGNGDDTLYDSPNGTVEGKNYRPRAGQGPMWTAYFSLPAADAKTLSLHLTLTEAKLSGASETLTLHDLPQPNHPKQGQF